ncbi:MAG: hypothetical protein ACI9HE_003932, partial [Planctomycetota bacterium]
AEEENRPLLIQGVSFGLDVRGSAGSALVGVPSDAMTAWGQVFTDPDVAGLLRRRFIPVIYETSGVGAASSEAADAFVEDGPADAFSFLIVCAPDGELLLDAGLAPQQLHAQLLRVLEENFDLDSPAEGEDELLAAAANGDAAACLEVARMQLDLGLASGARPYLDQAKNSKDGQAAWAQVELRLRASQGDWLGQALFEAELRIGADPPTQLMELSRGRRRLAVGSASAARDGLQPACLAAGTESLAPALHYAAGRAAWIEGNHQWARFHFGWVLRNAPHSVSAWRTRRALMAEVSSIPNPDLRDARNPEFEGRDVPGAEQLAQASAAHKELLPAFEASDFRRGEDESSGASGASANMDPTSVAVVAKLEDGAAAYADSAKLVSQLQDLGEPCIDPLVAAMENPDFLGRGQAANALAKVLAQVGTRPPRAMAALTAATEDEDRYVRTLARTAKRFLDRYPTADEQQATEAQAAQPKVSYDPVALAASFSADPAQAALNRQIVSKLASIGPKASEALLAALSDPEHPSPAWCAWALGRCQASLAEPDEAALEVLNKAANGTVQPLGSFATAAAELLGF